MPSFKQSIDIRRLSRSSTFLAIVAIVVTCGGQVAVASDATIPPFASAACEGESAGLPGTIQVPEDLRRDVERMLKRSATFREQCRRLAQATWMHVLVRINVGLADRNYRARSVIRRARSGLIFMFVDLSPQGSPVEWIAHEFEHALEQLEGVALSDLVERSGMVWRSSEGMFETERAIRAGRAVVGEMRALKVARQDKLVE